MTTEQTAQAGERTQHSAAPLGGAESSNGLAIAAYYHDGAASASAVPAAYQDGRALRRDYPDARIAVQRVTYRCGDPTSTWLVGGAVLLTDITQRAYDPAPTQVPLVLLNRMGRPGKIEFRSAPLAVAIKSALSA